MRSSRSGPDPLDPGPAGFAHRGLHRRGVPENSMAAFRAALDLGAGIECDVRLSADGEVMVFHDGDLERMCGSDMRVEAIPAGHLAAQRLLGTTETIPRLSKLLELVEGRVPLLVELKTRAGNAVRLAAAVARNLTGHAGAVGVMSFDPNVGWWLARNAPWVRRGLVVAADAGAVKRWTALGIASPEFLALDLALLDGRWAARMRRRRFVYAWTICSAEQRAQAAVQADALIWDADGRP